MKQLLKAFSSFGELCYWMQLATGCRLLDAGYWMQLLDAATGCRGYWMQLLDAGYWMQLLDAFSSFLRPLLDAAGT